MSFNKDEMLIMPAVDIKNGKCVQLVQGEPGSEMVKIGFGSKKYPRD